MFLGFPSKMCYNEKKGGEAVSWYVYMLLCGDGTLYTGITDDVDRRLAAHRSGRGPNIPGAGGRWSWCTPRNGPTSLPPSAGRSRSKSCGGSRRKH